MYQQCPSACNVNFLFFVSLLLLLVNSKLFTVNNACRHVWFSIEPIIVKLCIWIGYFSKTETLCIYMYVQYNIYLSYFAYISCFIFLSSRWPYWNLLSVKIKDALIVSTVLFMMSLFSFCQRYTLGLERYHKESFLKCLWYFTICIYCVVMLYHSL